MFNTFLVIWDNWAENHNGAEWKYKTLISKIYLLKELRWGWKNMLLLNVKCKIA